MEQELDVLQKTDHPHIVRVFELLHDEVHAKANMRFLLPKIAPPKMAGPTFGAFYRQENDGRPKHGV